MNHETTPRKSARGIFATPSNPRTKLQPYQADPYDSPTTFRRLFSPSTHRENLPAPSPLKAAIGPTPQRDGKALGLFDMLSESGGSAPTPSAKKQQSTLAAGFRTPSKRKTIATIPEATEEGEEDEEEESSRLSRTPASSTKQFYLANLFATPTTMRYAAMVEAEDEQEAAAQAPPEQQAGADETQRSNPSETPSFLRRSNSGRYPPPTRSEGLGLSPIASRKPRQFAGRGLSHLVKGLREMEEERMDEDMDMLREIEAEQEAANFQVPESQPVEYGKPYKKKGQKRTTRRVIMRPVLTKPKPQEPAALLDESSEDELAAVLETQIQEIPPEIEEREGKGVDIDDGGEVASLHTISEAESDAETEAASDSDDDPEYDEEPKPTRPKSFSERIKEAVGLSKLSSQEPPAAAKAAPAPVKEEKQSRPKKYNPEAHANYRSLKIKNRPSRGNGRFRRR